jgi:hypothetical protein
MAVAARKRTLKEVVKAADDGVEYPAKHEEFVTALYSDLTYDETLLEKKREYIAAVDRTGIKIGAVDSLAKGLNAQITKLNEAQVAIVKIKQLLAAGCEPTTPNEAWYAGYLQAPETTWQGIPRNPETWPCANGTRGPEGERIAYWLYQAPIPVDVVEKYAMVEHLLDSVRIYSPHMEDFKKVMEPIPRDPVMIGRVNLLNSQRYFEIARWDIDKDLVAIFTKGKKKNG